MTNKPNKVQMDKKFILWLCKDKLKLEHSKWDKHIAEILDQKYAEYRGWV